MNELSKIKLIAFDFDGVFTDNRVFVDESGRESVACWRSDGIGLDRIKKLGIEVVVISAEINSVVKKRCEKLGLACINGTKEKLSALKSFIAEKNLLPSEVSFVGNDLPDLECMSYVGYPISVKGSAKEVLEESKYTTSAEGGRGAVREICDMFYLSHVCQKGEKHECPKKGSL